jgi:hypothetical protein
MVFELLKRSWRGRQIESSIGRLRNPFHQGDSPGGADTLLGIVSQFPPLLHFGDSQGPGDWVQQDSNRQVLGTGAWSANQIPTLGVDVVRETGGRGLFIMEDTWHLSSLLRKTAFTDQHAQDLYAQFGALDRVAQVLIEKTRAEAS